MCETYVLSLSMDVGALQNGGDAKVSWVFVHVFPWRWQQQRENVRSSMDCLHQIDTRCGWCHIHIPDVEIA